MSLAIKLPLLIFVFLAVSAAPVSGTIAERVTNLETTRGNFSSAPGNFHHLGDRVLFSADSRPYTTDGTPNGTTPLAAVQMRSRFLDAGKGQFLFQGDADEVWLTDGTKEGTSALTAAGWMGSRPTVARLGATVFFPSGKELWKAENGAASKVRSLRWHLEDLTAWNGSVYFLADADCEGIETSAVWTSDGTAAGTTAIFCNPDERPVRMLPLPERLLIQASSHRIWSLETDGAILRVPGIYRRLLGSIGDEAWVYDLQNETVVRTRGAGDDSHSVFETIQSVVDQVIELHQGYALFTKPTVRTELLISNGDARTQRSVQELCGEGCDDLEISYDHVANRRPHAVVDGRLYFIGRTEALGEEIWVTDGTQSGTRLVIDACPGPCGQVSVIGDNDEGDLFFVSHGREAVQLWVIPDGRVDAEILADLRPSTPRGPEISYESNLSVRNPSDPRQWLFRAVHALYGAELMTGSERTQALVADLDHLESDPVVLFLEPLTENEIAFVGCEGNQRVVGTYDGKHHGSTIAIRGGLACRYIGRRIAQHVASERMLFEERGYLVAFDGTQLHELDYNLYLIPADEGSDLAFAARTTATGTELWVTDGTSEGTEKLALLPRFVTGRTLSNQYFGAEGGAVWTSDGTPTGTVRISTADDRGSANRGPRFTRSGLGVFFFLGSPEENLAELWFWPESSTEARLLAQVERSYRDSIDTAEPVVWRNRLFFVHSTWDAPGSCASTLWSSDGTESGTFPLWGLGGPEYPACIRSDLGVNTHGVLFTRNSPTIGTELWITDGSVEGTRLLIEIAPGAASSGAYQFTETEDGRVFFSARTPSHGQELWVTDGTADGTRLVHDIAPGPLSSWPEQLEVASGHLYFLADDHLNGKQLWALPLSAGEATCYPSEEWLCLKDRRFRVEMRWNDFEGNSGKGHPESLTSDTGYFWFFDPDNVETMVKVLDGRPLNDHFWTYFGSLSNVGYYVTVTDTEVGATRRYFNPPGRFASVGDSTSFGPRGAGIETYTEFLQAEPKPPAAGTRGATARHGCEPHETRLCLGGSRFAVEVDWHDFEGGSGTGRAIRLTEDTGYFWFFDDDNVEVVLKVLDGRALNDHFWVFYGALSNVEYTITVTDTVTGDQNVYQNPSGRFASRGDTRAFEDESLDD